VTFTLATALVGFRAGTSMLAGASKPVAET
jgi:hypothetical protein